VTAPVLFPYQREGVAWLATRKRAVLGDEMGLGKTPTAIRAAASVACSRIIVLTPASMIEVWRAEFSRWGCGGQRIVAPQAPGEVPVTGPVACVVSYDRAKLPAMRNALLACRWDVLICDEAHFLKNRTSARARSVLGPNLDEAGGLLSACTRAWGLTGTPMPNSADELWPLLRAFGPEALMLDGRLMPYWTWRRRYCVEVPLGNTNRTKIVGVRHAEELRERVRRVMLRRKKAEVLKDLPPIREAEIALGWRDYGKAAAALAVAEPGDMARLRDLAGEVERAGGDPDKAAAKLLEAASDESTSRLRRLVAALKAMALGALLRDEMEGGSEKLVVFGWHRLTTNILLEDLRPFGAVVVDGRTPQAQRKEAVDRFQADPACRVFIGQIQAAGTGLTLTAASDLVFAELSWVPAENAQAAMRVHRINQHRPVLVRYATLAGTIDEAVVRTLVRKSRDIASIIEQQEAVPA
jgi:SWI/SNF-related matrix-associated actin-dependent regulator 1 of chromatin subfamily A